MNGTIRKKLNTLVIVAMCCNSVLAQDSNRTDKNANVLHLPEFLMPTPLNRADTTYFYEYYDARSRKVALDTIEDFCTIYSVSMFKNYTDRAHLFVDKDGKEKPLPVSKIVYRYDRAGSNKWMTIDYATNKTGKLKEVTNEIVRTDSAVITTDGTRQIRINKYYRVIPNP